MNAPNTIAIITRALVNSSLSQDQLLDLELDMQEAAIDADNPNRAKVLDLFSEKLADAIEAAQQIAG